MNLGELIKAANQLDEADLDRLLIQVMLLRACRKVPVFPEEEAHLLQLINQGIPNDLQEQYKFYRESAKLKPLAEAEHSTLLQLSNQIEQIGTQRLEALASLTQLRQIFLLELMDDKARIALPASTQLT